MVMLLKVVPRKRLVASTLEAYHNAYKEILNTATLLKKRLWRRCFPVNFAKFVRTLHRTPPDDCFCFKHRFTGKVGLIKWVILVE